MIAASLLQLLLLLLIHLLNRVIVVFNAWRLRYDLMVCMLTLDLNIGNGNLQYDLMSNPSLSQKVQSGVTIV